MRAPLPNYACVNVRTFLVKHSQIQIKSVDGNFYDCENVPKNELDRLNRYLNEVAEGKNHFLILTLKTVAGGFHFVWRANAFSRESLTTATLSR
jgi:hypothetical protein